MGKAAAITEQHAVALRIVSLLRPASLLGVGNGIAGLLEQLASCGVAGIRHAASPEQLAGLVETYDLAVYADNTDQSRSLIHGASRRADRILFFPLFNGISDGNQPAPLLPALRLFDEAGFSPDFSADPAFLTDAAVLLRRRGTFLPPAELALASELLRLNATVQECLSRVNGIEGRSGKDQGVTLPAPASCALPDRQDEIERLINELGVAVAETREMHRVFAERLEGRVALLQSRTLRLQHTTQEILLSRIWRTLVATGGLLLRCQSFIDRLIFRRSPLAAAKVTTGSEAIFQVDCDEPAPAVDADNAAVSGTQISGILSVRGWALASSGIRRVEIQAGDAESVEARYGFYRPDVAAHYPGVPGSDRCGFRTTVDTALLPDGRQFLTIRAFNFAGATTERLVPILVDHINGYASDYHRWIAEFEREDGALARMKSLLFTQRPTVSVILPVYRTSVEILERTIASVAKQSYPNWQLCIVDDGSQSPAIDAILNRHTSLDPRVQLVRLPSNQGISAASNAALALARGEFVALLDHDDELSPHALHHFVDALNQNPQADIFYSDEDHMDETGLRSDPFFKPDWSPDLILAENYVNHLMIFRQSLAVEVGGFRSSFDLSQDHDILLRMSVKARGIVHIPKILYHWRTDIYSMRRASQWEHRAIESSRRVVADHLNSAGIRATVEAGQVFPRWRVRYAIPDNQRVRVLIPSANAELLERCLRSIAQKTDYPDYDIAVLDNSRSNRIERFVRRCNTEGRPLQYVDVRHRPFNYSALNNSAARESDAPLLLFLNDDITVITPDWLTSMVELASRPEVGAVGAKLLYPDGTIQHAGVVFGLFDVCGHAFRGASDEDRVYFDFPSVIRDVSAVTAACMMVPAKCFWECGGFDEDTLPIAYQDVDLCLKLRQRGYRVLVTPHARLYHREATSKRPEDRDPHPSETEAFRERWKAIIENDPFYNPNLTRSSENYSYRKKA
jgi:GT2 family glycosyltransferase